MNVYTLTLGFALFASSLSAQQDSGTMVQKPPRHPSILTRPVLNFPGEARIAGIEGSVTLRALVGTDGRAAKTEIVKRDPELAYVFDQEARRYVMNLNFAPATDSSGNPVSAWVSVPVHFSIPDFEPASVVEAATPEYPDEAAVLGIESWIGVAVQVDDMGFAIRDPKPIVIAREHHELSMFDKSAIDAAQRSRFTPAHGKDGNQIGWAYVKIVFRLQDTSIKSQQ